MYLKRLFTSTHKLYKSLSKTLVGGSEARITAKSLKPIKLNILFDFNLLATFGYLVFKNLCTGCECQSTSNR